MAASASTLGVSGPKRGSTPGSSAPLREPTPLHHGTGLPLGLKDCDTRAGIRNLNEGQKLSFDVQTDQRSGKSAAASGGLISAWTTAPAREQLASFFRNSGHGEKT